MERKYLRAIAIIAVVLTLLMLAYTMTAALGGNRSSSSGSQPPVTASAQSKQSAQSQPGQAQVDPKLFPQQLAGMNLAQAIGGSEAVQSVSQLHGTNIQLQRAFVVSYQGGGGQMTIWYSEAKDEKDAAALFKAMDDKMPKTQAFQNYKTVKVDGKDYKFVTGMGQEHYYWLTGKRVMWVAISAQNTADVLKQVAPLY